MANMMKYLVGRRLSNKLSLLVGTLAVLILLLTQYGDASPSTNRSTKGGKSASRSYRSTSPQGSTEAAGESNPDFNSTLGGGDDGAGKMCSIAGPDQPGCRKAGLDMKSISLELIRRDILKKLRIDENKLPNISAQNFVFPPSYLSGFVDIQGDSPPRVDYDDEHATTEKIIAFSKPEKVVIGGKQSKNLHHFSFSEKLSNMHIESATMYVHVRYTHHNNHGPMDKSKHSNLNIRIREHLPSMKGESPVSVDYGMFKPLSREGGAGGGEMAHHGRHSKWVQIDIRDALSKWVVSNSAPTSRKITLAIDAVDNAGKPSQEVTVGSSSESDVRNTQYPFIEIHVSDNGRSRQPRDIAMTCDENSQETRCCKYPLTVDFEEFGWDWIIAPKKYDAYYCSGECPLAFLQKYPHNHIVQQAMPSGVGGPCCAARKMSSISMLYFDRESNIVLSVLPGMVVEKCGCS